MTIIKIKYKTLVIEAMIVAIALIVVTSMFNTNNKQYEQTDTTPNWLSPEYDYITSVKEQASQYKGELVYSSSEPVMNSVNIIKSTYDCDKLKTLFIENTGWVARPMLADKILNTCLNK